VRHGGVRPSYTLTLQPTPDCADPIRILKGALRAHHMRCTDIREATGEAQKVFEDGPADKP
jgi:hypothetical protein